MSKDTHILCVAAGTGPGRYAPAVGFTVMTGTFAEMVTGDLWIGPRPYLETLLPVQAAKNPLSFLDTVADAFGGEGKVDLAGLMSGASTLTDALGLGKSAHAINYPRFIQIIPYYLFRNRGRFFNYLRPTEGSETRLHGKVSIGVGGHVDLKDVVADGDGRIDLAATLDRAGKREGAEEIGVTIDDHAFRYIGILYAVDTEVDRLHLGIVGICDLTDEQAAGLRVNDEIADHGFATLAETKARVDADPDKTLETWTRLVIESNPLA